MITDAPFTLGRLGDLFIIAILAGKKVGEKGSWILCTDGWIYGFLNNRYVKLDKYIA